MVTPQTESQARPLAKLPADQQAEVWQEAVETAPNGKVTAKHVESVVEKHIEKPKKEQDDTPEIYSSRAVDNVNNCSQPPANEAQARALSRAPEDQQASGKTGRVIVHPTGKDTLHG